MWFAKLFGGREDDSTDEEATAAPVERPAVKRAATAVRRSPSRSHSGAGHGADGAPALTLAKEPKRKGFDPYNSGSFERHNAWERVGRR